MKRFLILCGLFFILQTLNAGYKYELSSCAIFMEDDLPYMPEWIEFHKHQGIQHFYLYNNGPIKVWKTYLDKYEKEGFVEVIEWNYGSQNVIEWNSIQTQAYMHCLKKITKESKWCAIIDTDEFLFTLPYKNLRKALKNYEEFAGVVVNWVMYGTSNVDYIPEGQKLTDLLTFRGAVDGDLHVKSIVKPAYVVDIMDPHSFIYSANKFAVNENKELVHGAFTAKNSVNIFRINHYWCRDKSFLINTKLARRLKWGQPIESVLEIEKGYNLEHDDLIKNFNNYNPHASLEI
ncbi:MULTISPECIES: glycosyltransferase family 92 protein [unclassified Neochlamydia]|uniref:glycosyltransferase family 92 protein n=1 Tax=unclassified Neochlamydia TaxID=2643326 RepID=UPI00140750B6|nr:MULTISPECIES: glycosyltransferase family 92 protein [unclassified Neochlamydia]MBS4170893.1 Uncharacterized protein [Neochlamydia sp. AcF95]NGY95693.1 hypothetical protein [Neochlamydia sp. AcF84]